MASMGAASRLLGTKSRSRGVGEVSGAADVRGGRVNSGFSALRARFRRSKEGSRGGLGAEVAAVGVWDLGQGATWGTGVLSGSSPNTSPISGSGRAGPSQQAQVPQVGYTFVTGTGES